MVNATEEDIDVPVSFVYLKTFSEAIDKHDIVNKSDMVVYVMKETQSDVVMSTITSIFGGDKAFHAALLVFTSEGDQFDVISYLRGQQAQTSLLADFKIHPIFFKTEPKITEQVYTNLMFGILFGKLNVLKVPLCVYYSDLSDMIKVVESICPVKSSISLVSDPGIPFVKLHSQEVDKKVTYYG